MPRICRWSFVQRVAGRNPASQHRNKASRISRRSGLSDLTTRIAVFGGFRRRPPQGKDSSESSLFRFTLEEEEQHTSSDFMR